ncbi:hypothetical protein D3C76_1641900 [compost metagenome]
MGEFGPERKYHPGFAGKPAEHGAEWAGSDRIGTRRCFGIGIPILAQDGLNKSCLQNQSSAEHGDDEWLSGISGTRGAAWHG